MRLPNDRMRIGAGSALALMLLLAATACHTLSSITPNPAPAGATITLNGSGFGTTVGQVIYDGASLTITSWADARIQATLPAAKPNGTYLVQVQAHNQLSNALTHQILTPEYRLQIPDGTVSYLPGTACPSGWVELPDAKGRFVVGKTDGTVVGALVGDALAQGEDRLHGHDYATSVSVPGTGITAVTGCCNSSLGDAGSYDLVGTTDSADAALPRIQQLLCERRVTGSPVQVDDHPYPADTVMFFNRQSCPAGFSLMSGADGRFLVATPAGGDIGAAVGVALENREDRVHDHGLRTSIQIPESSVAALGGLNFNHTKKGVYDSNAFGSTEPQSSGLPYIQLLVCRASFRLPPPAGQQVVGDSVPSGTFAYVNALACPSGWTRSGAHEGRFLLGLPDGGVPYETRGGPALANREERQHAHGFSGQVTIPSLDVALVSGCCYSDTGAHGTFGYAGITDPAGTGLPYLQLLGCEKD